MTSLRVYRFFLLIDWLTCSLCYWIFKNFIYCVLQLQHLLWLFFNFYLFDELLIFFLYCFPYFVELSICLLLNWTSLKQFRFFVRQINLHFSGIGYWKIICSFCVVMYLWLFIFLVGLHDVSVFEQWVTSYRLYGLGLMGERPSWVGVRAPAGWGVQWWFQLQSRAAA